MSLRLNTPLPNFSGVTDWVNGQPDRASLSGRPVLVYFWSVSCYLSHENMPRVTAWREKYGPQGLKLIAIHLPRQVEDTSLDWVRQMADALWITDPCGADNRHLVKQAFDNLYVPAYFLFDADGLLRMRTGGISGLALLEQALKCQVGLGYTVWSDTGESTARPALETEWQAAVEVVTPSLEAKNLS